MPWLRNGDTGANHPVVLAVLEDPRCDDRLMNEAFGFVQRCALQSTAHLTDYVISHGTAVQMAGASRAAELIDVAITAGYWTAETDADGRQCYRLLDDDSFIHMRTREEIEWEQQRKLDNSNPDLTVPVRLRDGDACRYCGLVVNFHGDRKSQKAGTYDHLIRKPQSPDDMVVACQKCNGTLQDAPRSHREQQLMPAPEKPYFKPATLAKLADNEYVQTHNITLPAPSEPDVRAGRVPPGRDRGTPATKAAQTPPAEPARSEGLSDSQSERDPAGEPVRPVGPGGIPSHGDPADDSASGPPGIPSPEGGPAEAPVSPGPLGIPSSEGGPAGETTAPGPRDYLTASRSETPREPRSGTQADSSRFQQIPADRRHPGSGYAGTGRDGSGRAGTGWVGAGRTPSPPDPAPTPPSHREQKRRRRR